MIAAPFVNEPQPTEFTKTLAEIVRCAVELEIAARAGAINRALLFQEKLVALHTVFVAEYDKKLVPYVENRF